MRLLIELSERQFRQIEQVLNEGRYESIASFISAAIENQLLLEADPPGTVHRSAGRLGRISHYANGDSGTERRFRTSILDLVEVQNWRTELREAVGLPVHAFELTDDLYTQSDVLCLVAEPTDMLPGLISRFLPIKFGVRVLYSQLAELEQPTVTLESFLDKAGQYALAMGDWLAKHDKAHGRRREEALATGFPRSNRDVGKSVERYQNLFLASVRSKEHKADGALPFLKFAILKQVRGETHIGLTNAGRDFALIRNPVIDGDQVVQQALSPEERRFLISHIRRWVPGEYEATCLVLNAIRAGVVERIRLNKALAKAWPTWSPDQVDSWRSGLLSRMSELGLLERTRDGRWFEYQVSPRATELLELAD